MKELVAAALAQRVKDGECIGIGSGSTAELAVQAIGRKIAEEGISVSGLATSTRTAMLASEAGVRVLSPLNEITLDWAFDGADEVDPQFNMLKGNGGAMLSEKIVARRADKLLIIVSEEKLVSRLGEKFPVPIEVIPEAVQYVRGALSALGAREIVIRAAVKKYGPVITEHNNLILDVRFEEPTEALDTEVQKTTGVVDTGLFFNFSPELLVADSRGVRSRRLVDGKLIEESI